MKSDNSVSIMMASADLERLLGIKDIKFPFLAFPAGYEICPMFPCVGAAARFRIRKTGGKEEISVYLDTKEVLGFYGGVPYWEAYPIGENNERFSLDDTESLISSIIEELEK